MDLLSIPGTSNSLIPTVSIFADNVSNLLGNGANVQYGATIVVNSIDDTVGQPGVTTLRDAINKANADSQKDLIVFDRSLFSTAQTITLSGKELDITHDVDIVAPRDTLTGGDLVTVSGNNASRVFEIESQATVSFNGLIVADGGVTDDNGGGIKNAGSLILDSSIVRSNSAKVDNSDKRNNGNGGGIFNTGKLTLNNSTVSGNSALTTFAVPNPNLRPGTTKPRTVSVAVGIGGGILSTGDLTVDNSTISGNSANFGGGINNQRGTTTVENSTIRDNSARGVSFFDYIRVFLNTPTAGNGAGGIYNSGTLTVENSTISGNSAAADGGIYNNGTLTVENSTISGNSGGLYRGGIHNTGTLTVENSTISGNSGPFFGGGIYNGIGTTTVNNSTISGNSARIEGDGGGIYNGNGTTTVNNSTISGNSATYGGGIYNISGTITLNNSTISGNSARIGGSIYISKGTTTVNNSTISGNSASQNGGGIYNDYQGNLTLLFTTITQNSAKNGGGVYQNDVPPSSTAVRGANKVRNTIIAANLNTDGGVNPDVEGTFNSLGYNLIGDSTGSTGFGVTGDIVGNADWVIDPRLAPLANNGGSTQTVALLEDSPAIGAADPIILDTDPTTDQRGFARRAANGSADIGAFQFS